MCKVGIGTLSVGGTETPFTVESNQLTRLVDALPRLCRVVRGEHLSVGAGAVAAVVEEGVGDVLGAAEEPLVAVVADVELTGAVAGAEGIPLKDLKLN